MKNTYKPGRRKAQAKASKEFPSASDFRKLLASIDQLLVLDRRFNASPASRHMRKKVRRKLGNFCEECGAKIADVRSGSAAGCRRCQISIKYEAKRK